MNEPFDDEPSPNAIAILGMACRVPGASSLSELWESLCAGREEITRFSREDLLAAGNDPALVDHPDYVPLNRIVSDADRFDASFFGFTPREAELLDPQQRVLLECAHEALESAGYGARDHRGAVGVFAGVTTSSYLLTNLLPNADLLRKSGQFQLFLHNEKDFAPTRIAYKLDLRGPSVNVQTACSTSLVAVHMACQSLLESECDLALAGGSSIRAPQRSGYVYEKDMIFSPDGRSYAFDARARGTIAGNGAGMIVLKRLDAALADRDPILAVIRGSAINNDGAGKIGFTAPSVEGQARVIRQALAVASVSADAISYVEAHGTATPLGDPIEVAALTRAFRGDTERKRFCALGALKSNLGHMDAAAGVGGLIKAVLMLQHKKLTPSPNFASPNPQIDFASSPFYVSTKLEEWRTDGEPRRAGVSSFGIGGTNAHVILEEAPTAPRTAPAPALQLLTLSAKTESALRAACTRLADHLEKGSGGDLPDVAYTLHVGREPLPLRRAVVCEGLSDAIASLRRDDDAPVEVSGSRSMVFLFPGGGAQYSRMGRDLYEANAIFREAFDRCASIVRGLVGVDVREVLFEEAKADERSPRVQRPLPGFPYLFAVEYALASLLLSWGLTPQAMIGHSMGEYVAACLAGVFSLEDALLLVTRRAALFETLPPGGTMLAVSLGESDLAPLLGKALTIAAANTPEACTVSGPFAEIERLAAELAAKGVLCRRVHIDFAVHSPSVDPILVPFRETLAKVAFSPPRLPFVSSRTGTWITEALATDPEYWVQHLRYTVRFAEGLKTLLAEPNHLLVEVGPGNTLTSFARQHAAYRGQGLLATMRHPQVQQSDVLFLLTTLGALWSSGVQVDWSGFHAREERRRVPLPTYPFEKQRYWIEAPTAPAPRAAVAPSRRAPADWFYVPGWKRSAPLANDASGELRFVVFADREGLADALASALRREGHDVTIVRRSNGFARLGQRELALDPGRPEGYVALCDELADRSYIPDGIVHALSVTRGEEGHTTTPASLEEAQTLGLYSLLFLTQALDRRGWTRTMRVTALASNLYQVTGEEAVRPEKATLLGWLKTMPFELPEAWCKVVDVTAPALAVQREALAMDLCAEITSAEREPLVAYRGRQRWLPTVEPMPLAGVDPARPQGLLRQHGVYLITGGLGGVGLSLAAALAERAQARLVLLGRTALPPRSAWESLLADERTDAPLRDKLRRVREIERLGAEVLTVAADVCDRATMEAAIAEAQARFGVINGVIHAAGLPGGGMMVRQTAEGISRTLAPKVTGTLLLSTLFAEAPLDFMVLCSALVTFVGAFGSLDYTAANAFLDAFAHARSGQGGTRIVSIDWYRWQHLGMAKAVEAMHEAITGEALSGMTEEEGRDAFMRILTSRAVSRSAAPQVAVSCDDLERLLRAQLEPVVTQPKAPAAAPARPASHGRPALTTAFAPPSTATERRIAGLIEALLGIDAVGVADNFFELGGDSLVGTRLIGHLREAFAIDISLRELFEAPSIAELSRRIDTLALLRDVQGVPASSVGQDDDLEVGTL